MKGQKGFTLIELIIVIAIIAILAAVAIPNYLAFRDRANISAAKESMGAIRTALEVYRADHNEYPATISSTGYPLTSSNTIEAYIDDWNKVLANFAPGTFGYSGNANTYTATAAAKDRNATTVTATPGGIAP